MLSKGVEKYVSLVIPIMHSSIHLSCYKALRENMTQPKSGTCVLDSTACYLCYLEILEHENTKVTLIC